MYQGQNVLNLFDNESVGQIDDDKDLPQVAVEEIRESQFRMSEMSDHIYNDPAPVPKQLSEFELVSCSRLGSNAGGVFKNQAGEKYYIKVPDEADQARCEVLATHLYALTDIQVLGGDLIEIDVIPEECKPAWFNRQAQPIQEGGVGIATKWVEDIEDIEVSEMADVPDVRRGLAMDAWVAHYDHVGNYDDEDGAKALNMKRRDGKAYRIDFGGVFNWKARGTKKGDSPEWDIIFTDESVTEWLKYQNRGHPFMEPEFEVFGGMTRDERIESLSVVADLSEESVRMAVHKAFPGHDHSERRHELVRMLLKRQQILKGFLIEERAILHDFNALCSITVIHLENSTEGRITQGQKWDQLKTHGLIGKMKNKLKPEAMRDTLLRARIDVEGKVSKAIQRTIAGSKNAKISIDKLQKKFCPQKNN
jgi:hypothetical protein